MRALAILILILVSILAVLALAFPDQARAMAAGDASRFIYLLTAALFIGAGAFGLRGGMQRISFTRGVFYLAIWIGLLIAIAVMYALWADFQSGARILL